MNKFWLKPFIFFTFNLQLKLEATHSIL